MPETVSNIILKARALLDEYSDEGVLIPESEVIDLQTKSIPLVDMAQKELYKIGKLYKTFEFANKPAPNLLGMFSNFDIVEFIGTTQYYPSENGVVGAKAYYFEVDGPGTVTIQEKQSGTWTTLTTITPTATTMTAYKGSISPVDTSNPIRLVFSGTTFYRHVNRALYSYPFASDRIPTYRPWFKVSMPSDFRTVDQIVNEYPTRQYQRDTNYKWEGYKDLFVNYYYEGLIRIVYKPVPVTITSVTDTLEIDDITAQAIVYYVAARLAPFENKELVSFFESKYEELKRENTNDMPTSEVDIEDFYGGGR